RGYSGEETACDPNCAMNGTAIRQLSGLPMPGITFGTGFWLPPGPPLPDLPPAGVKPGPQPIRFEPQQSQSTRQSASQELPPPPSMRQLVHSAPENMVVGGSAPKLDVNALLYLRGKIEKIEFGNASYVIFLRASSVGASYPFFDGISRPNAL